MEIEIFSYIILFMKHLAHADQIWTQCGSDWPQMGQIRENFRSDSVHFGAPRTGTIFPLSIIGSNN